MADLPAPGTRVSLRYRLPAGSRPPLSDVVGHLLATEPQIRVRTKTGAVVQIRPEDVVVARALTAAPVRTAQIRATEHAAALAWPGLEQHWLGGWLLRAAGGHTLRADSAVPLGMDADLGSLPEIVRWYADRGLPPLLAVPSRLLRILDAAPAVHESVMLVGTPRTAAPDPDVRLLPRPDAEWLRMSGRDIPVRVWTAAVDGQVRFAVLPGVGAARAAVTTAPDGSRRVGVSAVAVEPSQRRRGQARRLCTALLSWGAQQGATAAYAEVSSGDAAALALFGSLGCTEQHRVRHLDARSLRT
ncbi:N-acetylglutamate synthase, CG3035 family [Mycolicibacterium thermoresistibile]